MINGLDITVLITLLITAFLGFRIGAVASGFYILSLLISYFTALLLCSGKLMNFLLIFMGMCMLVLIAGISLRNFMHKFVENKTNHIIGTIIGTVMGFVLIGFAVVPLAKKLPDDVWKCDTSRFYLDVMPIIRRIVPRYGNYEANDLAKILPQMETPSLIGTIEKIAGDSKIAKKYIAKQEISERKYPEDEYLKVSSPEPVPQSNYSSSSSGSSRNSAPSWAGQSNSDSFTTSVNSSRSSGASPSSSRSSTGSS